MNQERATDQGAHAALEGDTCRSGIGQEETIDVAEIPKAIPRGLFKPVQVKGQLTVITFDLETTGLIKRRNMPHITQIAAMEAKSSAQFSLYVTPKKPITPKATSVTGISMVNGEMRVKGRAVISVTIKSAIEKLTTWLSNFNNVCLVAHNGRRFDFKILVSVLSNIGILDQFPVRALIDSMSVFRKLYPKTSLKQVDLVSRLLGETYDAHNAMADVVALGKLLDRENLSKEQLLAHSFLPSAVLNNITFNSSKAQNLKTLDPLVHNGICKRGTAENIAGSGLTLEHLRIVYKRSGEDGLSDVFTAENCEGLPRVTNSKKVLKEVIPKLAVFFLKNECLASLSALVINNE